MPSACHVTGYIYVLRSKSEDPEIKNIKNLYKIVNMHSQKFEDLVHQVLAEVNFRFKVADDKGEMYEATEWYVVPLEIIVGYVNKLFDSYIYQKVNKNGRFCGFL